MKHNFDMSKSKKLAKTLLIFGGISAAFFIQKVVWLGVLYAFIGLVLVGAGDET